MDPLHPFFELDESFTYYTSMSAHQPAGPHGGCVPTYNSDHLVAVPIESRNRTVVDGPVSPAHILQAPVAPQSSHPLVYPWSGSTYMGFNLANNQIMEMSTPDPPLPFPSKIFMTSPITYHFAFGVVALVISSHTIMTVPMSTLAHFFAGGTIKEPLAMMSFRLHPRVFSPTCARIMVLGLATRKPTVAVGSHHTVAVMIN